ncbi:MULTISPECIES: potassium-transporting ATPase subunit KdpA [unclassified Modestobacter]|uniref:potassium-transporting ATPase subunit KdpA n=1 Tax=unclassified Modestobacter TaxID=2643866 RepID=UPI0022AAE588|nr:MULTISPECIES: potassium-transporting ATPase subunit KdpA [unclassified Modestobacter]MCZ2824293.1 potassium-transporting ATPase subunit KdpA [Modestobacter sp. VKM Ac-2981]MCZ2854179.1 potassium-transporting ATPase subunit KdpA [Modestobacter sp. VKM Ac-2982]
MSATAAGWLQVAVLVIALVAVHKPLGDWMARVLTTDAAPEGPKSRLWPQGHWRVERLVHRAVGVDADAEQRWPVYLRSVLAFSLVSVLFLYLLQRVQQWLPLDNGMAAVKPGSAWNTAISFVTNTNWQGYSGESTMGHLVQMTGLAVQNFTSAAVGIAVAVALVRGFVRSGTDRLGNFWVDVTRAITRVLLPLATVAAVVLVLGGVVQNLSSGTDATTLAGATQFLPGGPVASQEAIKELGTNGGGFYNANSAHPFEGPSAWISLFQVFLLLVIPFSLPRTFGRMVGDRRQGLAIVGVMAGLATASLALTSWAQARAGGAALQLAGAATEGQEVRFGGPLSALFGTATTLTSTGAVNSMHDSYTPTGGMLVLANMMLGEVAPGGVGSGLYGMLVLAVVAVFVAGLMVGRTPEYLGKKLGRREMTLASLYVLVTPVLVLTGTAVAVTTDTGLGSLLNNGSHGLSEVLYAFTSASNNNGSAFAGLSANTPFYNTALGLAMAFGRFLPIVLVVALAGRLAAQGKAPVTAGTLPTHQPLFVGLLGAVVLVVVGLTYFPALALGPLAEALA